MNCKICNETAQIAFKEKVLFKYEVAYYHCTHCNFIMTEQPYWLPEAYSQALTNADTGILVRNQYFLERVAIILYKLFGMDKDYLDYGGGYGVFTRMMRDLGFNYYWQDKYAQNLLARGFEHKPGKKYSAITAFEVFEHLDDVHSELEEMLKYSDTIIFSTLLHGSEVPSKDWWYYAFNHGQHIALYSQKSLEILGKKFGLNLYSNGTNLHMFTRKKFNSAFFTIYLKLAKIGYWKILNKNMVSLTQQDSTEGMEKKPE